MMNQYSDRRPTHEVLTEDKDRPWGEIIVAHELRECRKCRAVIANHSAYGRRESREAPNICECCE